MTPIQQLADIDQQISQAMKLISTIISRWNEETVDNGISDAGVALHDTVVRLMTQHAEEFKAEQRGYISKEDADELLRNACRFLGGLTLKQRLLENEIQDEN